MSMSLKVKKFIKTTITLSRETWERIKIEAIRKGLTLTQIVEAALRKYLEILEQEREIKKSSSRAPSKEEK